MYRNRAYLGGFLILAMLGIFPPDLKAAAVDGVVHVTLKNGLRVVAVRNTLAPVVALDLTYLAGTNDAPTDYPGVPHAVEHMMFRGSPGLSGNQLAEITGELGGLTNAVTLSTTTKYYCVVPAEDLDVALAVEALRMRALDIDPAKWAIERGPIEQEIARWESNAASVMLQHVEAMLFAGSPYQQNGLATRESIEKTPATALRRFYDTWYAPNDAVLVVVGDIDPKAAVSEIESQFGTIPAKPLPRRTPIKLVPAKPGTFSTSNDNAYGETEIAIQFPGPASPDYAAGKVLADVLSSQRGPLYGLVPAGRALNAGFRTQDLGTVSLGFAYGYFAKPGEAEAMSQSLKGILSRIVRDGVTDDMVEAAKRLEISNLEAFKTSVPDLLELWSDAIVQMGLQSPADMTERYAAVTTADVDRVARKYLMLDHAVVAMMTPVVSGHPPSGKPSGGPESFAAEPGMVEPLPAWAQARLGQVEMPSSTLAPTDITLANGLRLIVQSESVSDTVNLVGQVNVEPDLEQPPGKDGVDTLVRALFSYGSDTRDRIALQRELDGITASEQAGSKFYAQASSANFDAAVKLLADNELRPAFPAVGFKAEQAKLAQEVAASMHSPQFQFRLAGEKAVLPANDPELRVMTPDTVSAITLDDVRAYFKRAYRPDLTTIVVIGNITPDEARAVVERYFGAWKAEGPKPNMDLPPVPASRASAPVEVPDPTRVQSIVHLTTSIGFGIHHSDRFALQLGNAVLSQEGFTSWLERDLRVNSGLVYVASSHFDFSQNRGFFTLSYGADSGNIGKAMAMALKDLQTLRMQPLTAGELHKAQALMLRSIPLGDADEFSIAHSFLFDAANGLPLDEKLHAARSYLDLTPQDVQNAWSKDVDPDALTQVVLGPSN